MPIDPSQLAAPIEHRGIHHAGIVVADLQRSIDFYSAAFGAVVELRIDRQTDPQTAEMHELDSEVFALAIMRIGDQRLEVVDYEEPEGRPYGLRSCDTGAPHIAFEVVDVEEAYEQLSAAGMFFPRPPIHLTDGPAAGLGIVYGRDPDGVQIELYQAAGPTDDRPT